MAKYPFPIGHTYRPAPLARANKASQAAPCSGGGGVPDVRSCHFRPCFGSKCDGDLIILLGFDLSCTAEVPS